jgi:anti-anti-sigma factor
MAMSESRYRHLQVALDRGVLVLSVTQPQLRSLELESAEDLREDMLSAIDEAKASKVVVDLSAVSQFGSSSFRPLLSLRRKLHDTNGQMLLCGMQPDVREVFLITGLIDPQGSAEAPFEVERDVTAAVARLV